jgi:DNA ligase (NAD+)
MNTDYLDIISRLMAGTATTKETEFIMSELRARYYNGSEPLVEDAVYDELEARVAASNPALVSAVGAPTILAKTKHAIPMGSLNKAMNRTEFNAWALQFVGPYNVTYKMDGGSISLEYRAGALIKAVTRGDGTEGEDITHNAKFFRIPQSDVRFSGKLFDGYIRGEIILTMDSWKAVDPELTSNPRNLAIGISKRKDNQTEAKHIAVYAFRAYNPTGVELYNSESVMSQKLADAGFDTPPSFECSNEEEVWEVVESTEHDRSTLDFWIDGMVVTIDSIIEQRSYAVNVRPEWSIAVKFSPRTYETVLREVILQVGHTGKIVPVGKFDTVVIDGTNVSSALLCNWNVIQNLDIAVGDTVAIYKAGDIIPRVLKVLHRPFNRVLIPEPTHCPICGEPVARRSNVGGGDTADIFCDNDDCESKVVGKIMRYLNSLDIKELGRSTVETLTSQGIIRDIPDLYKLTADDLADVVSDSGKKLGRSNAVTIVKNIQARNALTLPELLGSIGVDSLGKGRVENIIEAGKGSMDTLADWLSPKLTTDLIATQCGVKNLGRTINKSLLKKKHIIDGLLTNGVKIITLAPKTVSRSAKTFTMTGTLSKPRNAIIADIEKAGHVYDGSVAKGLDYLVMEDGNSTSSKAVKARKLGIKTISEQELYRILSSK